MQLTWIKTMQCPECGETIVVKEEVEFFMEDKSEEKRTFACGKTIRNSFNKWDEPLYTCEKSPAYLDFIKKRDLLIKNIKDFLSTQDVNNDLIEDITNHIIWDARPERFIVKKSNQLKCH